MCRFNYEPGNLRPNRHEASIVQKFREVKGSLEKQDRNLCTTERNSYSSVGRWEAHSLALRVVPGAPWSPHIPRGGGCPTVAENAPVISGEVEEGEAGS